MVYSDVRDLAKAVALGVRSKVSSLDECIIVIAGENDIGKSVTGVAVFDHLFDTKSETIVHSVPNFSKHFVSKDNRLILLDALNRLTEDVIKEVLDSEVYKYPIVILEGIGSDSELSEDCSNLPDEIQSRNYIYVKLFPAKDGVFFLSRLSIE